MLLHTVVTHSSEEKNLKFVATVRAGVLNKMGFEILNYAVPRVMQVADSVSTYGHASTS